MLAIWLLLLESCFANTLVFNTVSGTSTGTTFSVTVRKEDGSGGSVSDSNPVTISLKDPDDSETLLGTLYKTGTASSYTFTGLQIQRPDTYHLVAGSPGFQSATSNPFTVSGTGNYKLHFSTDPANQADPCSGGLKVQVVYDPKEDSNPVASYTDTITLTLGYGDNGVGTLASTSGAASSGEITFNSCDITGSGNFVLKASAPNCEDGYSKEFTVNSGSPNTITVTGPGSVYVDEAFDVTVTVTDSNGVEVNLGNPYTLTVNGPGTLYGGSTSASIDKGKLYFTDVKLSEPGSHTLSVSCSACGSATITDLAVSVELTAKVIVHIPEPIFEGVNSQSYKIKLSQEPSSNVDITLTSLDPSITSLSTTSLTFTSANYNTYQTVNFNVANFTDTQDLYKTKIKHLVSSSDGRYNGDVDFQACDVTNGNEVGITVFAYNEPSVTVPTAKEVQQGNTITISVFIGRQPKNNVIIDISTTSNFITLSKSSLTFTSSGSQSFTVTADTVASFSQAVIEYSISSSSTDADYKMGTTLFYPANKRTTILIKSSDPTDIRFDPGSVALYNYHYETFHVRLGGQPSSVVTLAIESSDPDVSLSPTSLQFDDIDYKIYQAVQVKAGLTETSRLDISSFTITATATSSDSDYDGMTASIQGQVINICYETEYSWPNPSMCTCKAGFNCKGKVPVPCKMGTYSLSGELECQKCPAGYKCPDPTSDKEACPDGTYSYDFYTECLPCPGGFECPGNDGYQIRRCQHGTYSPPGQKTCVSPSANNMLPSPEFDSQRSCPDGFLIGGSTEYCVPCPGGHSCSGTTITACSAGEYSLPGMSTCLTCPDHHECDKALGPTRICPEGTYREPNENMCKLCPAGKYCTASEGTRPVNCPADTTSKAGFSFCYSSTTNIFDAYPGIKASGDTYELCDPGTEKSCYLGPYSDFAANVFCEQGWGRCYALPGGTDDNLNIIPRGNKYRYTGGDAIKTAFNGYMLPSGADRPDMAGHECPPGSWCTGGTKTECPEKTFGPTARAYDKDDFCFPCPPGFDCSTETGIALYEQYPCPGGKYCSVEEEYAPTPCTNGTYYNKLRGIAPGSCYQCPEGYECAAGSTNPSQCPSGHICPIGTPERVPCPKGTYNPYPNSHRIQDCLRCPAGHYCEEGSTVPVPCGPGKYNPYQGASDSGSCYPCLAGYACVGMGTVKPYVLCEIGYYCEENYDVNPPVGANLPIQVPCPPGTVGNVYGAYSVTQCDPCPPGFACGYGTNYVDSPPQECPAGYYCPVGTEHVNQYPCKAGTYNARTRAEEAVECLICPAGEYCEVASDSGTTCPEGYYCPRGTEFGEQYPCPAGTFRDTTGAQHQAECKMCTKGNYCPPASTAVTACPAGTYMDELGAKSPGPGKYPHCKPCKAGYYNGSSGAESCTAAATGKYTIEGDTAEKDCVVGFICAEEATSEEMMYLSPCPAGMFCKDPANPTGIGAYPTLDTHGCSPGKYCPQAATTEKDCPIGTYRNTRGAKSEYDCDIVPAGYYVSSPGTADYKSFECATGHYCPAGSISSTQEKCPAGTFRANTKGRLAKDCATCPAGKYCPVEAMDTPTDCPQGKYCPEGTITPLLCPKGSYGNSINLKSSAECTKCDPGKYCDTPGQTSSTGDCTEGFYCEGGAYIPTPKDGETGNLCPAGGYCTAGVTAPISCPNGKFNNFQGARSDDDCVNCLPGYYCEGSSNPEPTGQCFAGYYCTGSATSGQQHSAQAGYYAPEGSVFEIPCEAGTYNPNSEQGSCTPCTSGNYCPNTAMTDQTSCTKGNYCPQGSFQPVACPAGTFMKDLGASNLGECTACTATHYCAEPGKDAAPDDATEKCQSGFYCKGESPYKQPKVEEANKYGPCPKGHYCEEGTENPTPCPTGSYNPSEGAYNSDQCLPCPSGWACPNTGTFEVTVKCRQGFYCEESSTSREPSGKECTAGHKCPEGSSKQQKCPAGKYQDQSGQADCKECPPGYYCPPGTSDYSVNICPEGFYCPAGTKYSKENPCPISKYNPNQAQSSAASCLDCDPGKYCDKKGADSVGGSCDAGFYCTSASPTPRPEDGSTYGGRCDPGYYCPQGSSAKIPCTAGKYCPNYEMATPEGDCKAGYFCSGQSTTPTPTGTGGDICPEMYYCPPGSSNKVKCDTGKYLPYKGASASSECLDCTPGFYCDGDVGTPRKTCTAGYYCPGGDISPTNECDRGHYCPAGSADQIPCTAGEYQDLTRQDTCKDCTAGNYCEEGAIAEVMCPKGYYCPAKTGYRYTNPCPLGKYNPNKGAEDSDACQNCDPGKYCDQLGAEIFTNVCDEGYYCVAGSTSAKPISGLCDKGYYCPTGSGSEQPCDPGKYCNKKGLGSPSGSCFAGYYCVSEAVSPTPTDGTTGDICSAGKYCTAGSSQEFDCPTGTYYPSQGLGDSSNCIICPHGEYCASTGLTSPTGKCSNGFVCQPGVSGGKDSQTPVDGICPVGHYCEEGTYVAVPCEMGYHNPDTQQHECTQCPAGSYCEGVTATPQDCPLGYECPAGTRFDKEHPCGEGEFSDTVGKSACETCTAGRQCNNAAEDADELCPQYKYCPAGTGYGLICPDGTYNKDNEGLAASTDCTSCPAGQYCVDGRISGQCEAGYYCILGSPTPTPDSPIDEAKGKLCPPGHYCEKGTVIPTQCPQGKFRRDPGARQINDCTDCPPGSYCLSGEPEPKLCDKGYYCPPDAQDKIPCPKRTYNDQEGADDADSCKICPAGYLCNQEGIADYKKHPCKIGYFCVEGAVGYTPCPPGTLGGYDTLGAVGECEPCPGGYYCLGSSNEQTRCSVGTYCPLGSSGEIPCPPGFICDEGTEVPEPCPIGYYCPMYDRTDLSQYLDPNVTITEDCVPGTVCQGSAFYPQSCRPGTYAKNNSCIDCAPGTYSDGFDSSYCKTCEAGYICTGGAIREDPRNKYSDGGYPCPAGYYCPAGATSATACPVTTYNPKEAGTDESFCLVCPENTYGDFEGASKCSACGSHATSTAGSSTCECVGLFRSYQKRDGSCLCIPTYEAEVEGEVNGEVDSSVDCYPKEYSTCDPGTIRGTDGNCYNEDDCEESCNGNPGKMLASSGVCECENVQEVCDESCQESMPKISVASDGKFKITKDGQEDPISLGGSTYMGNINCQGNCKVHSVEMNPTSGPQGIYGVPSQLTSMYKSRRLQDSGITSQGLDFPLACINKGDSFMFSMSSKSYPVYNRDSLINTNKNFDYSPFQELKFRKENGISYVTLFSFTFDEPGIYDFYDSEYTNMKLIVAVMGDSESCPSSSTFLPRTQANLEAIGISSKGNLIEEPKWAEIIGIMLSVMATLIVLMGIVAFFNWQAWATQHAKERFYSMMRTCLSKCKLTRPPLAPAGSYDDPEESVDLEKDLLEPQQFQEMYERVCRYYDRVKQSFEEQEEDTKTALNEVLEEAALLRDYLEDRLGDIDPNAIKQRVEEVEFEDEENEEPPELEISPNVQKFTNLFANKLESILETTQNQEKLEQMKQKINNNSNLSQEDKDELIKDLYANQQRFEKILSSEVEKAQSDINKRLQQRAAKRRAAQKDRNYLESKREEIIARQKHEKEKLNKKYEDNKNAINQEYVTQLEASKKENRKEVETRLKSMRTKLQQDIANSRSQEEVDSLMKSFEIESKRIEEQLRQSKAKQEAETIKRLEERRKRRMESLDTQFTEEKETLTDQHREELYQLDQRALLGQVPIKVDVSSELNPEQQAQLEAISQQYQGEIQSLEDNYQNQLESIDEEIETQEKQELRQREQEKTELEQALSNASTEQEKEELMKSLQECNQAINLYTSKQETELQKRLAERRKLRAQKQNQITQEYHDQKDSLQKRQQLKESQAKSEYELENIEELLNNPEMTSEELISLARQLLESKHDRELADLTANKQSKLKDAQTQALEKAINFKSQLKEELRAKHNADLRELGNSDLNKDQRLKKQAELEAHLKHSLNQIDFEFINKLNSEQDSLARVIEEDYRDKCANLTRRQQKEVTQILKRIKGADPKVINANLDDMEEELENLRVQIDREHAEKLNELDKRAEELKEIERRKQREIKDIQSEIQEIESRQQHLAEIERKKQEMEEKQQAMLREMERRGITQEQMEEYIKKHQQEMEEWEKTMEEERQRQKQKLQSKLEQRKANYQEKLSSQIQKYKEENLRLIEQQEEEERNRLKVVVETGIPLKLTEPKYELQSNLKIEAKEIDDISMVDQLLQRVKRLEKIVANVDANQFQSMMDAFNQVNQKINQVKAKLGPK